MKQVISYLSQISKVFWILFGSSLVLLIIAIILLFRNNNTNFNIPTLAIFVFIANNALAIVFYQKDKIVPYILTIASILVSVFGILVVSR